MPAAPLIPKTDLAAARAWLSTRPNPRPASPNYKPWFPLAEQLHLRETPRWTVMNIARYLKLQHPQAKLALKNVSLNALHKALSRHLDNIKNAGAQATTS